MNNVFPILSRRDPAFARLIGLLCVLTLGISACQPSSSYAPTKTKTPTPTLSDDGGSDDEPTETPTLSPSNMPLTPLPASSEGGGDITDVCSLIATSEAEQVLGQSVVSTTPGSDDDSLTGQTINFCTYMGQGQAVVLSVIDTGSLDSAGKIVDEDLANFDEGDEVPSVLSVPGFGDLAYWTTTSHSAGYVVQKGTIVFELALGGNIGDPADHKQALLILAQAVMERL